MTNLRFKDFVFNHEHGRAKSNISQRTLAQPLLPRDTGIIGWFGKNFKQKKFKNLQNRKVFSDRSGNERHVFLRQPASMIDSIADLQPVAIAAEHEQFRAIVDGEGALRFRQWTKTRHGFRHDHDR